MLQRNGYASEYKSMKLEYYVAEKRIKVAYQLLRVSILIWDVARVKDRQKLSENP